AIYYATTAAFTHAMEDSERAVVQVYRDVSGGVTGCNDDDANYDVQLLAVQFCYQSNAVFSGHGT
ncbi:unnamed protein product, partial [marine sediment metagenome]